MAPNPFESAAHKQNMQLWKFAIEKLEGRWNINIWEEFEEKTGLPPSSSTKKFKLLLSQLHRTKFHIETKLMFCRKYNLTVTDYFHDKLSREAIVTLDKNGFVESWKLRDQKPNRDKEMSEKEFLQLMKPIVSNYRMETEDSKIWQFALENCVKFTGKMAFWNKLALSLRRNAAGIKNRFEKLTINLHENYLCVEDKLKLYKYCGIEVEKEYLKTLEKHADLTVKDGRITLYTLKRPGKRENTSGPSTSAKKPRTLDEDEDEDDEMDLSRRGTVSEDDEEGESDPEDIDPMIPQPEMELHEREDFGEEDVEEEGGENPIYERISVGGDHNPGKVVANGQEDVRNYNENGDLDQHASEDQAGPEENNARVEEVQHELVEPKSEPNEQAEQHQHSSQEIGGYHEEEANKKRNEEMTRVEERMMEWMQNNAKGQEKKIEEMNKKQMDRLEEVLRNGMQEMKKTASEQNMAVMAGIAALNTKMDVLRREVRNEESAVTPNFLEFIRSVNDTESPELKATVKTIEELIPMIPEGKRNRMLLGICTMVRVSLEMALL